MKPTQAQIDAASKAARDELAAISTWLIDYNSKISDDQMATFITKILTAALNVSPLKPTAKKGKSK